MVKRSTLESALVDSRSLSDTHSPALLTRTDTHLGAHCDWTARDIAVTASGSATLHTCVHTRGLGPLNRLGDAASAVTSCASRSARKSTATICTPIEYRSRARRLQGGRGGTRRFKSQPRPHGLGPFCRTTFQKNKIISNNDYLPMPAPAPVMSAMRPGSTVRILRRRQTTTT